MFRYAVPILFAVLLVAAYTWRDAETTRALEGPIAVNPAHEVVLLTTAWCGYCAKARGWLDENEIEYTEHDVEKSERGAALYQEVGARGVPVLMVNDEIHFGMNARAWVAALERD